MTAEKESQSPKAVRLKARLTRLQAMHSQLTSALKLCSAAENALVLGHIQLGHNAVTKARHTAHWIRVHLEEPNHIPVDSVASTRDRLAELEERVSTIEARLKAF